MIIRNRLIETELVKQMTLVVVLASHHRRLRHKLPLVDGITVRQSLQITSATKSANSDHSRHTSHSKCQSRPQTKPRDRVAAVSLKSDQSRARMATAIIAEIGARNQ